MAGQQALVLERGAGGSPFLPLAGRARRSAIHASPVPCRISRCCVGVSSSNGVSSEKPTCRASASAKRSERAAPASASGQAAIAPSRSDSRGSRISTAGFAPFCTPSPSHVGHQPSGLLNEK